MEIRIQRTIQFAWYRYLCTIMNNHKSNLIKYTIKRSAAMESATSTWKKREELFGIKRMNTFTKCHRYTAFTIETIWLDGQPVFTTKLHLYSVLFSYWCTIIQPTGTFQFYTAKLWKIFVCGMVNSGLAFVSTTGCIGWMWYPSAG